MQHSADFSHFYCSAIHSVLFAFSINTGTAASGFFGCATSPDGGDACSNMRWVPSGMLSNYSQAAGLIPTITAYKGDAYIVSPNCLG